MLQKDRGFGAPALLLWLVHPATCCYSDAHIIPVASSSIGLTLTWQSIPRNNLKHVSVDAFVFNILVTYLTSEGCFRVPQKSQIPLERIGPVQDRSASYTVHGGRIIAFNPYCTSIADYLAVGPREFRREFTASNWISTKRSRQKEVGTE